MLKLVLDNGVEIVNLYHEENLERMVKFLRE